MHRLILLCLLIVGVMLATSQSSARGSATGTYQPPIGIPAPEFGIEEVAPPHPVGWPQSEVANFFYVDNTHPQATDIGNPYGFPDMPRETIPETDFPAGSYVEIHGGVYDDDYIVMDFHCTVTQPCWVRGTPEDMPKISGMIWGNVMTYVIFEYLDFVGGTNAGFNGAGAGNHIALHHSLIHDKTYVSNTAGVAVGPVAGGILHDVVVYNNRFYELGNWQAEEDEDFLGFNPSMWGLDNTSGAEAYNIWFLDNYCYHISGDCVQVNAGWGEGVGELLHHIYIGNNTAHHNRQSGVGVKQSRDVIISQNTIYGHREVGEQPGDGIIFIYDPDNIWMIYNRIYDNNFGIRQSETDGNANQNHYIIGNIIYNNEHDLDPCGHWGSPNGWGISLWYATSNRYIINNTIFNTRGGIEMIVDGPGKVFISNNIIAELNGMDYENASSECGSSAVQPGKVEHLSLNEVSQYVIDHNFFAQTDGQPIRIDGYQSLAAFQQNTGICGNCLEGNPHFVNGDVADFSLLPDSPAIDAGIESSVYQRFFDLYGIDIRLDFNRQPRTQGENWDIGAFESSALPLPLTLYLPMLSVSAPPR